MHTRVISRKSASSAKSLIRLDKQVFAMKGLAEDRVELFFERHTFECGGGLHRLAEFWVNPPAKTCPNRLWDGFGVLAQGNLRSV